MYLKENGHGEGTLTRHSDAPNYNGVITSRTLSSISQ